MTSEEILSIEMDALIFDLGAKHIELGMKASGEWLASLKNQSKGLTGLITGKNYTEWLVNGRKPGKFPPIAKIKKWIEQKGLTIIGKNISVSSLAFLIARKIAREGTKYFKDGGTELISAVITPERIQSIINKVTRFNVNSFVSEVTNAFKQLEVN